MREDPLLNDLNLLTRLLFLLVIFKKVFSMSNLKICYQLYFNYINILINYLLNFYFPRNQKIHFQFYLIFMTLHRVDLILLVCHDESNKLSLNDLRKQNEVIS